MRSDNEDIQLAAQEILSKNLLNLPTNTEEGQASEQPLEEQSTQQDVEEGQSAQDTEEQQDYIEFMADGATHKASIDEIKELASKGLNYTRKTQELAERVKTETEKKVQERTQALESERKRILDSVDMLEGLYDRPFVTTEQLDKLIAEGDYDEYHRLNHQETKRKEILEKARTERQKIHEAKAKESQEQFRNYAIQQTEILINKMPELKVTENQEKLAKYLVNSGFNNDEIQNFVDSRGLMIAEKARRYDELSKSKVTEPVRNAPPKVIRKVGSSVSKQTYTEKELQTTQDRLKSSGNLRDAASLILQLQQKR